MSQRKAIIETMARAMAGNVTEQQMKYNPIKAGIARGDAKNVLAALESAGYVIVKREPDDAMLDAADAADAAGLGAEPYGDIYRAMIAAQEQK